MGELETTAEPTDRVGVNMAMLPWSYENGFGEGLLSLTTAKIHNMEEIEKIA